MYFSFWCWKLQLQPGIFQTHAPPLSQTLSRHLCVLSIHSTDQLCEELSAGRLISRTPEPTFRRRVPEWALPLVIGFQKRFPEHLLAGKLLQAWLVRTVSSGMTCLLSPPWSAGRQMRRPLHNWLGRAGSYNHCYVAIISSSASLGFRLQNSTHRTF